MIMKKKTFCILTAILLLALISISVPAAEKEAKQADSFVIDNPEYGFHFVIPEKYRNLKGTLDIRANDLEDGVFQFTISYYAVSEENFDAYNDYSEKFYEALMSGEEPPASPDPSWMTDRESAYLYDFFSINAGRGEEELRAELKKCNGAREDDFAWLEKLGSDGEYNFFGGQYAELEKNMEEYREVMGEEYFREFEEFASDRETILQALTFHAPEEESEADQTDTDDLVSFETTDLDGNPVSSKDLFAGSKVTMINLWATWCYPCKKEMPQLAELSKEFGQKGCQIVGVCLDANQEGKDALAKEILEENGVGYLNLVPPEDLDQVLPTDTYPTSFFFDSNGRTIVEPIRGAHVEEYLPALDAALAQSGEVEEAEEVTEAEREETEAETEEEPEVDYSFDIGSIHVGQTHRWTPYSGYPQLQVTYSSSDPQVLSIDENGMLTAHQKGEVLIEAAVSGTSEYKKSEYSIFLYVLPETDGLYLTDIDQHFYYQGSCYQPGELPLETERALCLTQPDLKVFLEQYLEPCQAEIADPTEAALTAILNYGAEYFSKNSLFEGFVSAVEAGKTDWMMLLLRKRGMCSYNASYFCYLMYLAGLPSMQVANPPEDDERAHSWNMIAHDGYLFNLEEYDFLHEMYDRCALPPLSERTAAFFPGNIIGVSMVHFPVEGVSPTPDQKVEEMGRDLSASCPVLLYERGEDGKYRVWFDTISKGHIPAWSDGTPLSQEEVIYRNMETDTRAGQYNEEAKPLFDEANQMLREETGSLYD